MPRAKSFITVLALCAAGAVALHQCSAYRDRQAALRQERSAVFFRLKVDLTYKGQPVGFDIVVGCGVRVGRPLAGGTSSEIKAMTALVYAKAIPDGHAISVRSVSPDGLRPPCQGATTANGEIPRNWLPTIVWYERAEDLSHGLAYITEDAFRNPKAQLGFGGAVVEAATRAEYEAFVASTPPNLIPSHLSDWMSHLGAPLYRRTDEVPPEVVAEPWRAWSRTDWLTCRGMRRLRVPAAFVERVRQAWPSGRPRIWVPDRTLASDLSAWMHSGKLKKRLFRYGLDTSGATNPDGEEVFASRRDDGLSSLKPATFQDGTYYDDTVLQGSNADHGFAFCDRQAGHPLYEKVTGRKWKPANNVEVTCRIDGHVVNVDTNCMSGTYVAIQDDKYLLDPISSFGD